MTITPAYLSPEAHTRLSREFEIGALVTLTYEEGTGGPLRQVLGYGLDHKRAFDARPGIYSIAPIRYVSGSKTGERMNNGSKVTLLVVPMARVVSIQAVYGA